jgi:hypothetical protein
MAGHYAEALGRFRNYLFSKWADYLKPRVESVTVEEQDAIKATVVAAFNEFYDGLHKQLIEQSPHGDLNPDGALHRDFHSVAARELAALEAELGIDMTTPSSKSSGPMNVNTFGPNSPVVVGPGRVTQTIQTNASAADLAVALGTLLAQIDAQRTAGVQGLDDARDMIEQAKEEAERPQPSLGKVGMILRGTKPVLEAVAVLGPALTSVVAILSALGL